MLFKSIIITLCLAAIPPCQVYSQTIGEQHISNFGGINNFLDPMMIADGDAQNAKNVITDEGDLRTIPGNVLYTVIGSSAISYLGEYVNPAGSHELISKTGLSVFASTITINTLNADRDIDMVSAFNSAYFVDGTTNSFSYNGTSVSATIGFEDCKFVEYYQGRMVCVNMSTDSAKIDMSWYNNPALWTVTSDPDSGSIKYFDREDGYGINCVKSTPFGLFLGKGHSTQFLKGDSNDTFYQVPLSGDVGCVDDRTIQLVDGELVWLSQDGWYAYDGASAPRPISIEVKNATNNIRQSAASESNVNTNTQSVWQAGTSAGWDSVVLPNSIKTLTYDSGVSVWGAGVSVNVSTNAGFNDGTGGGWTGYPITNYPGIGNVVVTNYQPVRLYGNMIGAYWLKMATGAGTLVGAYVSIRKTSDKSLIQGVQIAPASNSCTNYTFSGITSAFPVSISIYPWGVYGVSTMTTTGFTASSGLVGVKVCSDCNADGTCDASQNNLFFDVFDHFDYTSAWSPTFDTALSTITVLNSIIKSSTDTTLALQYSTDSVKFSTSTVPSRYFQYQVHFTTTVVVSSFTSVDFSVLSTAPYYSQVHFTANDVSQYKQFTVNDTEIGATPSFYVRTATYAFDKSDSVISWVPQVKNALITASTAPYIQFGINPNITTSTQSVIVNSVNMVYRVGSKAPRAASVVADHRYICSVSTASPTQNDTTFIWQKNKKWTLSYDVSYGAMSLYNNFPLAGDGSATGKIWTIMQGNAYSFDHVAIDSFWQTKSFAFSAVNNQKVLNRIWVTADNSGMSKLNIGWQAERDGIWHSTGTSLSGANFVIREVEGLGFPSLAKRQFSFGVAGNELDKYFRLKLLSIYFTTNPLIK